jgi:anti-anti-sigma factor
MPIEPCVTVSLLFGATSADCDVGYTIVRLHGHHDASTAGEVSCAIRRAVAIDSSSAILDLEDVAFMDSATINVIINAETLLSARSLTLRLRRPSRAALRVIGLCSVERLLESRPFDPLVVPSVHRELLVGAS